jgi:hypothetical protein
MLRSVLLTFVALTTLFCLQDTAQAGKITLTPDEMLQFDFTSPGNCPSGPCNALVAEVEPIVQPPTLLLSANLYSSDGDLLGTASDIECCLVAFTSSTSTLNGFLKTTIIDFNQLEGPFSGYMDVTSNVTVDINSPSMFTGLSLEGPLGEDLPITQSVGIVPEPRLLPFICLVSLCALGLRSTFIQRSDSGGTR